MFYIEYFYVVIKGASYEYKFWKFRKIDEIYNLLVLLKNEVNNKIEKRWLTSEELSLYIGYSKESIKKFLKDEEVWIELSLF